MEDKVLYNALKNVGKKNNDAGYPDNDYKKSMQSLGLIKIGWDDEITKFEKW